MFQSLTRGFFAAELEQALDEEVPSNEVGVSAMYYKKYSIQNQKNWSCS